MTRPSFDSVPEQFARANRAYVVDEIRLPNAVDVFYCEGRRDSWGENRTPQERVHLANVNRATPFADLPSPPRWMTRGACLDTTGLDFFRCRDFKKACAVCDRCEVRQDCLDYACAEGIAYGVWGGTTADDRVTRADFMRGGNVDGTLYAVRMGALVKVGFTEQALDKRIKTIRNSQHPDKANRKPEELLINRLATLADERRLHATLDAFRAPHPRNEREWYHYSPELLIALGLEVELRSAA